MGGCIRSALACLAGITVSLQSSHARAQSFELADEYALPQKGLVWAAADFDADGDQDIAIVTADGAIATAFNDGEGTFTITSAPAGVPIGETSLPGATQARAGDFDGDGAIDLMVSSSSIDGPSGYVGCEVSVFLNRGDGTFEPGYTLPAVPDTPDANVLYCTGLDAADYDGDGTLDFALAFNTLPYSVLQGVVDVFLGNGDGTFASPTLTALSDDTGPYVSFAMTSGDFDGDGKLDLGLGEDILYLSGPGGSRVQLLSGDGAGNFSPSFTEPANLGFASFAAAQADDVTSDGRLDLLLLVGPALSGGGEPSELPVLLASNTGSGGLSAPVPVAQELGVVSFESRDFDGDHHPDLLLVSAADRETLARGNGAGSYATSAVFAVGGSPLTSLAADFDADGRSDLAVLDASRPIFSASLASSDPVGFPLPRVTPLSVEGGDQVYLAPGDYNGDGKVDLLASEYGAFDVLLGTGDGRFTLGTPITNNGSPSRLLVADLNDDGTSDLVLPGPGATFRTLFGSPDGTFSGTTSVDLGQPGEFSEEALGDFDEDGDLDLAAVHVGSGVRFYRNDGAGNFAFDHELALTTGAARLVFADLNGDSHLDLFFGASPAAPGDSLTLLGDGSGGFTAETALPAAADQFELGDVNGDGRLDVVTNTSVALGNGDGTFGPLTTFDASSDQIALDDMDGDGLLDLVIVDSSSVGVALGNGDGTFQPKTALFSITAPDWPLPVVGVADFTGDGAPDLFTARVPNLGYEPSAPEVVTLVSETPEPPPVTCPPPHGWPPPHRRWPLWRPGWGRHARPRHPFGFHGDRR